MYMVITGISSIYNELSSDIFTKLWKIPTFLLVNQSGRYRPTEYITQRDIYFCNVALLSSRNPQLTG